jgi:hypothetical protein
MWALRGAFTLATSAPSPLAYARGSVANLLRYQHLLSRARKRAVERPVFFRAPSGRLYELTRFGTRLNAIYFDSGLGGFTLTFTASSDPSPARIASIVAGSPTFTIFALACFPLE